MDNLKESKYFGYRVVVTASALNIRKLPGTDQNVVKTLNRGDTCGYVLALYKWKRNGYTWYAVSPAFTSRHKVVFVAKDFVRFEKVPVASSNDAEKVINGLINNDKQIYKRLIVTGALLKKIDKNTNVDTSRYWNKFNYLARNLARRQTKLKNSSSLHTYNYINEKYEQIKNWFGLGAFPVIAVVGGVIAGAALAVVLYYMFKPDYDESKVDLKISGDLKKILDTLPKEKQQQITANLEKQIDDAYNQGKIDGSFSGVWNFAKYGLIAVGVYSLYQAVKNKQ